jgi:hypothetical protein
LLKKRWRLEIVSRTEISPILSLRQQTSDPTSSRFDIPSPHRSPRRQIQRAPTRKRIHLRILKRIDHRLDGRIATQSRRCKTPTSKDDMPDIDVPPPPRKESPNPPLHPTVRPAGLAGRRIKAVVRSHCIFFACRSLGPGLGGSCRRTARRRRLRRWRRSRNNRGWKRR